MKRALWAIGLTAGLAMSSVCYAEYDWETSDISGLTPEQQSAYKFVDEYLSANRWSVSKPLDDLVYSKKLATAINVIPKEVQDALYKKYLNDKSRIGMALLLNLIPSVGSWAEGDSTSAICIDVFLLGGGIGLAAGIVGNSSSAVASGVISLCGGLVLDVLAPIFFDGSYNEKLKKLFEGVPVGVSLDFYDENQQVYMGFEMTF